MDRVLTVTVQAPSGLSSGYVWWLGEQEILFWCYVKIPIHCSLDIRIDWGTRLKLLDCEVTVHSHLLVTATRVKQGYAHYGTFELKRTADADMLGEGLSSCNQTLKTHGRDFIPSGLVISRRKAESRLGHKLPVPPTAPEAQEVSQSRSADASHPLGRMRLFAQRAGLVREVFRPGAGASADPGGEALRGAAAPLKRDELLLEGSPGGTDEFARTPRTGSDDFQRLPSGGSDEFLTSPRTGSEEFPRSPSSADRLRAIARKLRGGSSGSYRKVSETSKEPSPRSYLKAASFAPGPPATLLVRILDPAQLRRAMTIDGDQVRFCIYRVEQLQVSQQVILLVSLPDSTYLELQTRVVSVETVMVLAVDHTDETVLGVFRPFLQV